MLSTFCCVVQNPSVVLLAPGMNHHYKTKDCSRLQKHMFITELPCFLHSQHITVCVWVGNAICWPLLCSPSLMKQRACR